MSHYKYIQIINTVNSTRNFIVNMSWYEIKIYELAYYVINGAIQERRVKRYLSYKKMTSGIKSVYQSIRVAQRPRANDSAYHVAVIGS